jgi:PEGA domain
MSAEAGKVHEAAPVAPEQGRGSPVAPTPGGPASGAEVLAAVLKLGSALGGLAAAVLFVLPAVGGDFSVQPRLKTLTPTFGAPPKGGPSAQRDASPAPVQRAPGEARDPFATPEGVVPVAEAPAPDDIIQEERADFDGAILVLESEPSGALTFVAGKEQGETPVSVGLDCKPGEAVEVEFVRRGYERARHTATCPRDAMLKLTARLRKGTKGAAPR